MTFGSADNAERRGAPQGNPVGRLAGWATPLLGGALVAFNILLPLDRGFPRLPVLGHPLSAAVAATAVVFAITLLSSGGHVLRLMRAPYCVLQTLYFVVLITASLRAESPLVSLHLSLVYYCTFVLNYVILLHVAITDGPRRLSSLVLLAGIAAALVGILQAVWGLRLGAYDGWYSQYFGKEPGDLTSAHVRAIGTLNNPILYGVAVTLVLPYALHARRLWIRVLSVGLLVTAAVLTASRTALAIIAVFFLGALRVYRWRVLATTAVFVIGAVCVVQLVGGSEAMSGAPRVSFLVSRVGLGSGVVAVQARDNIEYRQEALREGIGDVVNKWGPMAWVFGLGQLSAASVGGRVLVSSTTTDNALLGVLYEKGLVGLALFLAAFAVILHQTAATCRSTLHWYAPVGLLVAGMSFNFEYYSTFNVLVICSMAITTSFSVRPTAVEGLPRGSAALAARGRRR